MLLLLRNFIMVRPVPKKASFGGEGTTGRSKTSVRGMEWSLRSLRKIDTETQYFAHNYYSSDSDSEDGISHQEDQTAYEIFKGKQDYDKKDDGRNGPGGSKSNNITGNIHHPSSVWAALNVPLRVGVVDSRKIIFELLENVTKKPTIPRSERLNRSHIIINGNRSAATR